jgi:electron transfer flavoprotein alpha subunit/NAD-dependent dihydropyrimidine dehydrogenase PreA subunit
MPVVTDITKCKGQACRLCLPACPYGAIFFADGKKIVTDACVHCGGCIDACVFDAIQVEAADGRLRMDVSMFGGICVFVEQANGCVADVSMELLGKARELADDRVRHRKPVAVTALMIGETFGDLPARLIESGADHVLMATGSDLGLYHTEIYTDVGVHVLTELKPEILLFGATAMGRDLAPRIANRLQTGLTADCTALRICPDEGILLQTCPAFGGDVMATIVCPDRRPQIATVRPGVMMAAPIRTDRRGTTETVAVRIDRHDYTTRIVDIVASSISPCRLSDAKIIVAGGRGMKGTQGFAMLRRLADALGAELAASRGAVDAGWIDAQHQVGQTGETVQPDLYIACGISGAVQHLTGMMGARHIISINKDEKAPINQIAHDVYLGDLFEIIPMVTKKLEARCACQVQ